MEFSKKLIEFMDRPPKISGSIFSKKTNISQSMISDIRNGRRLPSWEKLNIIIKTLTLFEFEEELLIELWKKEQDSNYIPKINEKKNFADSEIVTLNILGKASAGRGYINFSARDEYRNFIPTPNLNYNNCFIIKVDGDSMEPEILDKSELVIDPTSKPIEQHINKIIVATINSETFVKTLRKLNNKFFLESTNKDYEDIEIKKNDEFFVIGRAIEVRYSKTLK